MRLQPQREEHRSPEARHSLAKIQDCYKCEAAHQASCPMFQPVTGRAYFLKFPEAAWSGSPPCRDDYSRLKTGQSIRSLFPGHLLKPHPPGLMGSLPQSWQCQFLESPPENLPLLAICPQQPVPKPIQKGRARQPETHPHSVRPLSHYQYPSRSCDIHHDSSKPRSRSPHNRYQTQQCVS